MKKSDAERILGPKGGESVTEIKRIYRSRAKMLHPDNPDTGDTKSFVLLLEAFMTMEKNILNGASSSSIAMDEFTRVLNLKGMIDAYYDGIFEDFSTLRVKIETIDLPKILRAVSDSSDKSELRSALNGRVKNDLLSIKSQIEAFIKGVGERSKVDNSDFLYNLFSDMYRDYQQYWLMSLWKNPFIWLSTGTLALLLMSQIRHLEIIPNNISILLDNEIAFFVLFVIMIASLFAQYLFLSPQRQYVPPRLSVNSIWDIINSGAAKLGLTTQQTAWGGAAIGGASGLMIGAAKGSVVPIFGTIVGGVIGLIVGAAFGKEFSSMKSEVSREIESNVSSALSELSDKLLFWIKQAKSAVLEAAKESLRYNVEKVGKLVQRERRLALQYYPTD